MEARARLLTLLSPALLLFSTLLLFAPLQVSLSNLSSFSTPPAYHALTGLALTAALTAAACAALLLPRRAYAACVTTLLATGIGFWAQGNLMLWKYGPMDGRPIDWAAHRVHGAIDGAVWLLLGFCAWRFSPALLRGARTLALFFVLLQAVSLGVLAVRTREQHPPAQVRIDERGKFELSTKRNIVLLIFDEFQGDVFPELLARDPKLAEVFDGFVRFPDTLAGASFTEIAVPFLLTGELYDNSLPRSRFLEQAFTRQAIPRILIERGYDAELYPWEALANDVIYRAEGIASNFKRHAVSPGYRRELREYGLLLDVALFRQMPHLLKRYWYDQGAWGWRRIAAGPASGRRQVSYTDNNGDLQRLARESRAVKGVPVFKAYHFAGAHVPLHDYGGSGRTLKYSRANYLKVTAHLLALAGEYLARLKQIGVYGETMVFVLGDHGSGRSRDLYVAPPSDRPPPAGARAAAPADDFQLWKARGLPLLLAKDFNARGRLRDSAAPASLGDLPKTIAAAAGSDRALPGHDLFTLPEGAVRTRKYASFAWSPKSSEYLLPITLYAVDGPVWLDASWRREKIQPPAGQGD